MWDALQELIKHTDNWVIDAVTLAIGLALAWSVLEVVKLLKGTATALNNTNKLLDLQDKYEREKEERIEQRNNYAQLLEIRNGLTRTYGETKHLLSSLLYGGDTENKGTVLLNTIVNNLTSEIKSKAGGAFRCAIWIASNDEKSLIMSVASSGFGGYDLVTNPRFLKMNNSKAGHCFSTQRSCNVSNVNIDNDFVHSGKEPHKYSSLICVPILFAESCWGVITVDGKEDNAFTDEDVKTVESYAEVVSMTLLMIDIYRQARKESATYGEEAASGGEKS